MLLVELFNNLAEKQIWGRKGKALVRKFRCSGGKRHGRIVSKAKHATAKREKRLVKAGFGTKKGKFGFVKLNKTSSRRSKK